MHKFFLSLNLILINFLTAAALTVSPGKVYRFINIDKPTQSLAAPVSGTGVITTASSPSDLRQQWYLTSNENSTGYYFRNAATGAYLESSLQTSVQWSLAFVSEPSDMSMLLDISQFDNYFVFKAKSQTGNYSYAHNDASNNVVCWLSSSSGSKWSIYEVNYSDDDLKKILDGMKSINDEIANANKYQNHLDRLFEDKACSKLLSSIDPASNPDYLALSPTLRKMTDKIISGDWSETNGDWDSNHAKKYRLQLYEPYSEGSSAAALAGIQPYTNMNNPTGILADKGDLLYIMVNDDVPEDATLYINGFNDNGMHNSVTEGTKLNKGLNIILCNADNSNYFIYYTVNTVKSGNRYRKLSDFKPISIHIEGGRLNGFFNYVGDDLYAPDTREDFLYTSSRATFPMYDLLGKYVILHFFLEDTPNQPGETAQKCVKSVFDPNLNRGVNMEYDPAVVMSQWDEMCFSERIVMGIQDDNDIQKPYNQGFYQSILGETYKQGEYEICLETPYSEYFNNRIMGITLQGNLYMNATSWRTAYAPSTLSVILPQFKNNLWGPAHECGHLNQIPMKIAGTTEESNNLFSNVALYYTGTSTSRCNYPSAQLEIFNEGKTYLEHGTWGTTRMFWQLWCYYHAAGYNRKFYPRLYELLRKYPLVRDLNTYHGKLNPRYDLLHFAKMCCVAAGEDLSDFFKSWGFFVPQDNYHINDYSVYDCILTQEDIDAVLKEIKDLQLPANRSIILIDDRPGSDRPNTVGYDNRLAGELGGLKAFAEKTVPSGEIYYKSDFSKLTIEGDNLGVGFLVYSDDGELLAFSNSLSFPITFDTAFKLSLGQASVFALSSDNSVMIKVNNITEKDSGIESVAIDPDKPVDIYSLQGILLKKGCPVSEIYNLKHGVYLIRSGTKTIKIFI